MKEKKKEGRPIALWVNPEQETDIKKRAKKSKRTVSNYIKRRIFSNDE